ncbi:MAG: hypothetical protein IM548_07950 [Chitinophagaceae bacterium]|nr:hypothetical protein [Chitinophagaceae bacterium]
MQIKKSTAGILLVAFLFMSLNSFSQVQYADTSNMLLPYLRKTDTATMLSRYLRRTDTSSMLIPYLRKIDTSFMLSRYLRRTDTVSMLLPYLRKTDTATMLSRYLRRTDTASMLLPYLRKTDTATMLSRYLRRTDTAFMLSPYLRRTDTASMLSRYLRRSDTAVLVAPYLRRSDTTQMLSGYLRSGNLPNISGKMNYTDTLNMLLGYLRKADTSQMLSGYLRSGNLPNISGKMNYTDTLNMLLGYLRKADTSQMLSGYARTGNIPLVNAKVNYTDTLSMLLPYLRKSDTTTMLSRYLRRSDTASLVLPYLRKTDTAFMMSRYLRRTDTAFMLLPYLRKIDTASMLTRYLRRSDTAILVAPYLRRSDTSQMLSGYVRSGNLPNIAGKMNYTDSANMLINYLRKSDTSNLVAPYLRRSDTANMLKNYVNIGNLTAAIAANTQVPDLQQVLSKGNVSSFSATIGSLTTSSPTLLLNNGADTAASLSFVRSLSGEKLSGSGTAGYMPIYNSNSSFSNSLISQQNAGAWNNRKIHFADNSSTTDYLFYTPSLINQYGYPTGLVITGDYSGYNNTVHFNQMTDLGAGWTSQFAFTPYDGNGSGFRTALYIRGNGIEATESVSITGANTFWNSSKPATLNLNSGNVNWNFNTTSGSGTWLDIRESSSVRLRIMSGGRLLLNTTTDNGVDRLQVDGSGRFVNNLTANAFVKLGGTASQYLMADGSVSTLPSFMGGSGTINFIPKFTSNNAIGNSQIFDNGSNIGIGTINPISTLHVSGTMRQVFMSGQAGDGLFGAINGVSNGYRITNDASNNLTHTFHTGSNTAALHIASTGNIGIGTTSPANKFVVSNAGASGFEVDPAGGVNSGVLLQAYNRSTSAYMPQSYYALSHTFNVGSTGSTRAFDISSSGNVGIGTTSPAYPLQVRRAGGAGSLGISIDAIGNTDRAVQYFSIQDNAAGVGAGHAFYYRTPSSTTDVLGYILDEAGNVGIGTASPAARFVVADGRILLGTNTDNGVDRLQVNGSGRFVNNLTANAFVKSGGTASQYLMADGSVSTLPSFMGGSGTTNYLPKFTSANGIGNSQIFDNGTNVLVGTTATGAAGIGINPSYNYSVAEGSGNSFFNLFRQANSAATVIANGYKYSSTANGFASSTSNPWGRSAIALGYGTGVISFFADGISTVANGTNITPSERMRITPTGNVGIGETNPSGRLEVRSSTGHVGLNTGTSVSPERGNLYYSTDGTGWKFNIGKLQSGTFTPQMTFQDNGNVGIGTSNPSGQFETYTDGYRRLAVSYPSSSETRLSLGANAFINQHANNEELSFNQQYGSGKITFYTGYPNSEKMRITASGNIGIGTINPQANLSIKSGSNVDAEINSLPEGIDIQSFNRTSNSYGYISFKTNAGNESMRILNTGQICVGCLVPGTYKMAVDGAMAARSLRITQTAGWADYVFDKKYNLRPLDEVEKFIQENQHLPDLPSATTVAREGIDVADMQAKLLSKIEELTLYVIELKKEVETLKKKQSKKSSSKK